MDSIYAFAWDYDSVGNRTRQEFNGAQAYYEYAAANALSRSHDLDVGWSYFEYESRGNCLQAQSPAGTQYFTYDHRNLLSGIRYRDASTQYFHYDAQMRMCALDDNGAVTYYTWDRNPSTGLGTGGMNPLVERDSGGRSGLVAWTLRVGGITICCSGGAAEEQEGRGR